MPKTVEIIGPSGSGKSSIYNILRSNWKDDFDWVTFDDLHRSKKKLRVRYFRKVLRIFNELIFNKRELTDKSKMNSEWGFINYDDMTFLGGDYSQLTTAIMDLVEDHCGEWYDGSDKRFVTIYMMMWSIAHYNKVVTTKGDDRYCILKHGEGFISRIMHLNSPSFDENALQTYLSVIPIPDQVIFLDVPVDEIVNRIENRNRLATLHKGMVKDSILEYTTRTVEYLKIAMEKASEKGTVVKSVNAFGSVDDTAKQVMELITY